MARKKSYTDEKLQDIMNNPGSESENEEDNLESDIIDDSDNDKHYEQSTSSDEDSEEFDEMEYLRRASKRQRSIVPPPAVPAAANDEPASPTPGTSAGPAVARGRKRLRRPDRRAAKALTPAAPPAAHDQSPSDPDDPAVPLTAVPADDDGDNDVSRIINFGKSTVTSKSGFRCRPQTSTSVRTAARNIVRSYTRGYTYPPPPVCCFLTPTVPSPGY